MTEKQKINVGFLLLTIGVGVTFMIIATTIREQLYTLPILGSAMLVAATMLLSRYVKVQRLSSLIPALDYGLRTTWVTMHLTVFFWVAVAMVPGYAMAWWLTVGISSITGWILLLQDTDLAEWYWYLVVIPVASLIMYLGLIAEVLYPIFTMPI